MHPWPAITCSVMTTHALRGGVARGVLLCAPLGTPNFSCDEAR